MLHYYRLQRLARVKHSGLQGSFVTYEENKYFPRANVIHLLKTVFYEYSLTLEWSTSKVLHLGRLRSYSQPSEKAGKACQIKTLLITTNIYKLRK
jgi:hypothetical protein